ncbi:hypothetical protein ACGYKB_18900 [Sulfitobacter sp. 916]|uniref:antitoxin PaaA2 family protein n=1 Tax=Sulfitobacter sp. 916 TaxID=3368559 RepID=UPI003745D12C
MAADVNSYDAWFRAQVQTALEDARAGTSQVQVMQAAQRSGKSNPSPDQALEVSAV